MAHAAGLAAPIAVITAVTANITHGINATRPPTARMALRTIRSTVPLERAMAKNPPTMAPTPTRR